MIVQEVPYRDPLEVFASCAYSGYEYPLFLDGASDSGGRYSYIVVDPFLVLKTWCPQTLKRYLSQYSMPFLDGIPPFQGGVAGFLSYDAFFCPPYPEASPPLCLGFYDVVISFDTLLKKAFIISTGFSSEGFQSCSTRARRRCDFFLSLYGEEKQIRSSFIGVKSFSCTENFVSYAEKFEKIMNFLYAGDIFQANFSQNFTLCLEEAGGVVDSVFLYSLLRHANPSEFSSCFILPEGDILSASPESFLTISGGFLETRPIKGTAKRYQNPEEDRRSGQELLNSEKNRSENIMIVDLMRNDLSKVCEPGSVNVPVVCALSTLSSVHHLVSLVRGKLMKGCDVVDVLLATFPGGSVTGAPKAKAIDILYGLEQRCRGVYCGSLGYFAFNGDVMLNILIRTCWKKKKEVHFAAGGGIVVASQLLEEYYETLGKLRGIFAVFGYASPEVAMREAGII